MVNYNALVLPPSDYSGEFEWVSRLVDHLLHRSLAEETFSPCHELMSDARPTIRNSSKLHIFYTSGSLFTKHISGAKMRFTKKSYNDYECFRK